MRNVTMVVPVLMMSCQVSEYPNAGPVIAQTTMMRIAMTNAQALPRTVDVFRAKIPKASRIRQKISRSSQASRPFFFFPFPFFAMHISFALGVRPARIGNEVRRCFRCFSGNV